MDGLHPHRFLRPHPVSTADYLLELGRIFNWIDNEEVGDKAEVQAVAAVFTQHENVRVKYLLAPRYGPQDRMRALVIKNPLCGPSRRASTVRYRTMLIFSGWAMPTAAAAPAAKPPRKA